MSIAYLKVKIKSIAAEAAIIRHEERKYLGSARWLDKHAQEGCVEKGLARFAWAGLQAHRLTLRLEQRAAYLAYGYLRGRAYRQIEQSPCYLKAPYCRPGPSWVRVFDLVWKYGPSPVGDKAAVDRAKAELRDRIKAWSKIV